jgi:hypothetical protein
VVARVRCVSGELLTIASLNTRGIPLTGSQLAERYADVSDHIGLPARLSLTASIPGRG